MPEFKWHDADNEKPVGKNTLVLMHIAVSGGMAYQTVGLWDGLEDPAWWDITPEGHWEDIDQYDHLRVTHWSYIPKLPGV